MKTPRDAERMMSPTCEDISWLGELDNSVEMRFMINLSEDGKIVRPIHVSSLLLEYTDDGEFYVNSGTVRFGAADYSLDRDEKKRVRENVGQKFCSVIENAGNQDISSMAVYDREFLHASFGRGIGPESDEVRIPLEEFSVWLEEVVSKLEQELSADGYI